MPYPRVSLVAHWCLWSTPHPVTHTNVVVYNVMWCGEWVNGESGYWRRQHVNSFCHCVNIIWLFSSVVMDTSDVCCSEEPPPYTEDVGGTWGRCVSQGTSESHSSVCTHNLIQHSTHDTNHVHRIQPLPFTGLPVVDPLSVWSTCCPSLERGCLRWMIMVRHVFTMQLEVVASQWWGTSWTDADLNSV